MMDQTKTSPSFSKTLSWRSAKIAVIATLITGTVFATVQVYNDIMNERKRIELFSQETLLAFHEQAARAAYRLDETVGRDITNGLLAFRGVIKAQLIDDFNDLLATSERNISVQERPWLNRLIGSTPLITKKPLYLSEDRLVGHIVLEILPFAASPGFAERTNALIMSGFLKGSLLSIILMIAYHQLITKRIISAAKDLGSHSHFKANPDDHDEIDFFLEQIEKWKNDLEGAKQIENRHKDWFRLVAKNAGIGFWEWDIKTGKLSWDETMLEIYEMKHEDYKETYADWSKTLHPDDRVKVEKNIEEFLKGTCRFNTEFRILVGPERKQKIIMADGTLLCDEEGHPNCVIGINRDITGRRHLEKDLNRSRRMEAIGNLTGGVAHDYNNSLQAIMGHLEFLKEFHSNDRDYEKHLNSINRSAKRSAAMTKRLLAFSRKQKLESETFNLSQLITEIDPLIRQTIGPEVKYQTFFKDQPLLIKADPAQLEEAIINLVKNASEAMQGSGSLNIEAQEVTLDERPLIEIRISDTGDGISEKIQDQIFEPFFTTKAFGEGSGLGLSMVYGFVKQSNGEISFKSDAQNGTTFYLHFAKAGNEMSVAKPHENLLPEVPSLRIVLIEDDPDVIQICQHMLEKLGHKVSPFTNGHQGVTEIREGLQTDLVITDIHLNDAINGNDIAQALKNLQPDLSFIFISGYKAIKITDCRVTLPGHQILSKPFTLQELAKVISLTYTQASSNSPSASRPEVYMPANSNFQ